MNNKITMILMITIAALFIVSCTTNEQEYFKEGPLKVVPPPDKTLTPTLPTTGEATQELKKFANTNEIIQYLKDNQVSQSNGNYYGGGRGIMMDMAVSESAGGMGKVSAPSAAPSQTATDFSTTNVKGS